jgi:hypothetical protein
VTTSKRSEVDFQPKQSYGSSLKSGSLSSSSNIFGVTASSLSSTSSSGSETTSGSTTGAKTLGEEMKKLGLDYETMKKKWIAEGSSG